MTNDKSQLKSFWRNHLETYAHISNILVFFISLAALFVSIYVVIIGKNIRNEIERYHFIITNPQNGSIVGQTEALDGVTPYKNRNHYIVVTPVTTGDDWVQDHLVTIDDHGFWRGVAVFGSSSIGQGQDFIVRVLATRSPITPSRLPKKLSSDAIFSQAIKVTRKK